MQALGNFINEHTLAALLIAIFAYHVYFLLSIYTTGVEKFTLMYAQRKDVQYSKALAHTQYTIVASWVIAIASLIAIIVLQFFHKL